MRREGWEGKLEKIISDAREQPYKIGVHDCFRVACRVLEALTGEDRWPEFAGRYRTTGQARRLLAGYGSTFEAAGDWFFRSERADIRTARRGDIVAIETPNGEKHLGVVTLDGARAALLGPEGLVFVPVLTCLCCWKIG
jgi:hypothetical protein